MTIEKTFNCLFSGYVDGCDNDSVTLGNSYAKGQRSLDITVSHKGSDYLTSLSMEDAKELVIHVVEILKANGEDVSEIRKAAKEVPAKDSGERIEKVNCVVVKRDFIESEVDGEAVIVLAEDEDGSVAIRLNKKGVKRLRKMLKQRLAELD
ncbi:hypothetical protein [Bacillus wiedmannii]|uniref:hypothetical protein n=1 Tax=Bacillus wiedmannii TaxID=1890302 RepID=UPI000BF00BEE|nr:hypothetical protein [Bacillus wiedmannii]PEO36759.1 hypothetical protein CN555_21395 [Bacillus wiedmannii]